MLLFIILVYLVLIDVEFNNIVQLSYSFIGQNINDQAPVIPFSSEVIANSMSALNSNTAAVNVSSNQNQITEV